MKILFKKTIALFSSFSIFFLSLNYIPSYSKATDTLAPYSQFSYAPQNSISKYVLETDGHFFFRDAQFSESKNAIIYEVIKNKNGHIVGTREVFNSIENSNRCKIVGNECYFIESKSRTESSLKKVFDSDKEYIAYFSNFRPRYDEWGTVLIDRRYVYPSLDALRNELIAKLKDYLRLLRATPEERKVTITVNNKSIQIGLLVREIRKHFGSIPISDLCLLYDMLSERIPLKRFDRIKLLEERVKLHQTNGSQVKKTDNALKTVPTDSDDSLVQLLAPIAQVSQMRTMASPSGEALPGAYEITFSKNLPFIDTDSQAYLKFRQQVVDLLSNKISTYGGSLYKQIREKILTHYSLPSTHPLDIMVRRNANVIDSLLEVDTTNGRARYSNIMTDNPNAWKEALTYLFKEQDFVWQDKVNLGFKEIMPEFSAISVFDILGNGFDKKIFFPFASVAEVLAYAAQMTSLNREELPDYITDEKAWVNHWQKDKERRRLLKLHWTFIKKVLVESRFVEFSDPLFKGKYSSYEELIQQASYDELVYILKKYVHEYLPTYQTPQKFIEKISNTLKINKREIVLADMVFLDVGLVAGKVGLPRYVNPAIILMLSDPTLFAHGQQYPEGTAHQLTASYMKEAGIPAKMLYFLHHDKTPFVSQNTRLNPKLQEIETMMLMLSTALSLDTISPIEKQRLIEAFKTILSDVEPLYEDFTRFSKDLKQGRCYKFIPQKLMPLLTILSEHEEDTKNLYRILDYVKRYGLENRFVKVVSDINNKDVFLDLFRNGNLKKILELDMVEHFLSITQPGKEDRKPKTIQFAKKARKINVRNLNNELIQIEPTARIRSLRVNRRTVHKEIKQDIQDALVVLKKQEFSSEPSFDLDSLLKDSQLEIVLYRPTENVFSDYLEQNYGRTFFVSHDASKIYIDQNFWNYLTRDNLTKANVIASILANCLVQINRVKYNKEIPKPTILPGNTLTHIVRSFFTKLFSIDHDYIKKLRRSHPLAKETTLLVYGDLRQNLEKDLIEFLQPGKSSAELRRHLNSEFFVLINFLKSTLLKGKTDLDPADYFISEYFEIGKIFKIQKLINQSGPLSKAQRQNIAQFYRTLRHIQKYLTPIEELKEFLLVNFGNDVKLEKVYREKDELVAEIFISNKDLDLTKVITQINRYLEMELTFTGFSRGQPVWRVSGWKDFIPDKFVIKGTNVDMDRLHQILRHNNEITKELLQTLNPDMVYLELNDRDARRKVLHDRISSMENSAEIIDECFRYILTPHPSNILLYSNLFHILGKAIRILENVSKNNPENKRIIENTISLLKTIFKERETGGKRKTLIHHYTKKDSLGRGVLEFFRKFKKAELHRHITGSISPELLLELFWQYPNARKNFLLRYFPEQTDAISTKYQDNLLKQQTAIDKLFRKQIGGPSSKKKSQNLLDLIQEKNRLTEQAINLVKLGELPPKRVLDRRIRSIEKQIRSLCGGKKALTNMKKYIEYRPEEKIGVSIIEYLERLEPAKFFLKEENALEIMTMYARASVYDDFTFDNITLTELRTSGIRPGSEFTLEETIKAYIDGLIDAELLSEGNLSTGYILCLNKDIQNQLSNQENQKLKENLRRFKDTPLADVKQYIWKQIQEEINTDYRDLPEEERQTILREERRSIATMMADAKRQLSYGRIEDIEKAYSDLNFRLIDKENISKEEEQESLKIKMLLFLSARKNYLDQTKSLLRLKEKWSQDEEMKDHAKRIKGLDCVWSELDEIVWPALAAFRYAKHHGLNTTYHVGESWREGEFELALIRIKRILDCDFIDRIGHGTALGYFVNMLGGHKYSYKKLTQIKKLQRNLLNHPNIQKVVIESCPTSNVYLTEDMLGYKQHVSRFFLALMLNVTLNEDNGRVLHTNGLSGELARIWLTNPNLSFQEIVQLLSNSFLFSFVDDSPETRQVRKKASQEFAGIKNIHQFIYEINPISILGDVSIEHDNSTLYDITLDKDNHRIETPEILIKTLQGVYYFKDAKGVKNLYILTQGFVFTYDFEEKQWQAHYNLPSISDIIRMPKAILQTAA